MGLGDVVAGLIVLPIGPRLLPWARGETGHARDRQRLLRITVSNAGSQALHYKSDRRGTVGRRTMRSDGPETRPLSAAAPGWRSVGTVDGAKRSSGTVDGAKRSSGTVDGAEGDDRTVDGPEGSSGTVDGTVGSGGTIDRLKGSGRS